MRKLSIADASLAAAFLASGQSALAANTPPQPEPHIFSRVTASTTASNGCQKLIDDTCTGLSKRIEWKGPETSWGTTRIGIENYSEHMGRTFFERNFSNSVAKGDIHLDWNVHMRGYRLTLDHAIPLGQNAAVEVGAFVGRVSADASAGGAASLTVHPRTITTPPLSYRNLHIPSYSYDYKGDKWAISEEWSRYGASPDAGVSASAAWAAQLTPSLRAGVSGFGAVTLARTSYGAGAALYYSSSYDNRLGKNPGGECTGNPLRSSAKFAFAAGVCFNKIQQDRIADGQMTYAQRLANKATGKTYELDNRLDELRDKLPSQITVPSIATNYTAQDAARVLGFRQGYQEVPPALVVSATMSVGENGAVSLSHLRSQEDARTAVSFAYSFK